MSRIRESVAEPVSSAVLLSLLFRWLVVGVPLGWGVWRTAVTSMKLFQ